MEAISEFFKAILDGIAAVFIWFVEKLLMGFAKLIALIPVPDWMNESASGIQQMFDIFGWGLSIAHADFGFTVIFSALFLRFVIRRLPVIG